jgi:elongation factor P
MLKMNDLKSGVYFIMEGDPFEVLETHHLKMQQRRPVLQTRMKNLRNGKILERNFQQSDSFEEADIKKNDIKYLYNHRDEYWFSDPNDLSKRFKLDEALLEDTKNFLKVNTVVEALEFNGSVINIEIPIKMDFKVIEAPPAVRGDTAQGGIKQVVIETGAKINTPLFIEEGDTIRVNTHTGEYVERIAKK